LFAQLAEHPRFVQLWWVMPTSIRISRLVLCFALLSLLLACQRFKISGQGTSEANRHTLFDFREEPPMDSQFNALASSIPPAVLSTVFPNYSPKTGRCKAAAGQPKTPPRLLGSAEGAFTEAGASQTAYLLDPGGCETDPTKFGNQRLAIFSGDQLAKMTRVSATELLKTYDLDQDGRREFLLAMGNTRDGIFSLNAHLLGLEEQTYKVIENFGRVRFANCAAKDGTVTAVKLDYLPEVDTKTGATVEKLPRFTAEVYRADCPKQGQALASAKWIRVEGVGGQ
jgi:hypothetical protein